MTTVTISSTPLVSVLPIAVGGVGGSGTRLIASWMKRLGVFIGTDLNLANDTLWFTLLFKRAEILGCDEGEFFSLTQALVAGLTGGQPLSADARALLDHLTTRDRPQGENSGWLKERAQSLAIAAALPAREGRWGWKEPNTHLVIDRFWTIRPELRYVHVVRHGLDMALSANQNQVKLWGAAILGEDADLSPARSLSYWCSVQKRMQKLLSDNPQRMFWLDYDALCRNPLEALPDLLEFLGFDRAHAGTLAADVHASGMPPRHAGHSLSHFRARDVEYVRSLGYPILAGS